MHFSFSCSPSLQYWAWQLFPSPFSDCIRDLHRTEHFFHHLLQILHSGLWTEGSGYSVGEQAEQYFSHESSRCQTVKTMSLPQSVDTLTQSAEDWAERKRQSQPQALVDRYTLSVLEMQKACTKCFTLLCLVVVATSSWD